MKVPPESVKFFLQPQSRTANQSGSDWAVDRFAGSHGGVLSEDVRGWDLAGQASGSIEKAFFVSRYQPMPLIGFLQRFFIASWAGW